MKPRPYLSYSSFILWKKSPELWCRHYILEEDILTEAMSFGKRFAEALENDEETGDLEIDFGMLHIPVYPKREYVMKAKVKNAVLLGKFDGYDPKVPKVGEVKSGKTNWTQKMVDGWTQLTWYALLHYLKKKKIPELYLHHYNQYTKEIKHFKTERTLTELMKLAGEAIKVNQEIKSYLKTV